MTPARRRAVTAALLACAAGLHGERSTAQVYADREPQLEIWNLRCEGRYAEALAKARVLRAAHRGAAATPPYVLAYDDPQVAALERAARLGPAEQAELADADAMGPAVTDAHDRGDYATASRLSEKQLEVYRRLLGAASFDVARTLDNLGFFDELAGHLDRAEQRVHEAEVLTVRVFGATHPEVAWRQSKLANILHGRGQDEEAEVLLRAILETRIASLGPAHAHVASAHNDLAVILRARGEYAAAEEAQRRALAIQRDTDGPRSVGAARSLDNLATLARERGDLLTAEELYREVIAIRREALGAEHPHVATAHVKLAGVLGDRGRLEEAATHIVDALRIRLVKFSRHNPRVATLRLEHASLLRALGQLDAARAEIDSAFALQEVRHGRHHPQVARTLWERGLLCEAQGDVAGAARDLDAALAVHVELLGESHPIVVAERTHRAALLQARGDDAQALKLLEAACRGFEIARRRVRSGPERGRFLTSPYPRLALARLHAGDSLGAWEAVEQGSARVLGDMLAAARRRDLSRDEFRKERRFRAEILQLESQLGVGRDGEPSVEDGAPEGAREDARRALHRAQADWLAFERDIARRHPAAQLHAPTLHDVQARLGPGTAVLGWLDVDVGSGTENWAYVIRDAGAVRWVRLPAPEGRVQRFRDELAGASTWPFRVLATARTADRARQAWDARVAPVAGLLDSVASCIVVPSGDMQGVPFEALQDARGRYAGATWTTSYVPSLTVLVRDPGRVRPVSASPTALLVGDPRLHEGSPPAAALARTAGEPPGIILRSALACNAAALATLPELPGTRHEIRAVQEILPGATLLLGPDATEQRLAGMAQRGELAQFDILHLATHAIADAARPDRSALVLSYPGQIKSGVRVYDGLMDAREIIQEWRIDAELVTLSACRTVGGGVWGSEGELGLAAAFLQAGARSLLVTLWPVDDTATALLVRRFYENLCGRNGAGVRRKDAALRDAKSWLRAQSDAQGHRPYEHPAYWSGFVLVGDAR